VTKLLQRLRRARAPPLRHHDPRELSPDREGVSPTKRRSTRPRRPRRSPTLPGLSTRRKGAGVGSEWVSIPVRLTSLNRSARRSLPAVDTWNVRRLSPPRDAQPRRDIDGRASRKSSIFLDTPFFWLIMFTAFVNTGLELVTPVPNRALYQAEPLPDVKLPGI